MPYGQEYAGVLPSDNKSPYDVFMEESKLREARQLQAQERAEKQQQQQMALAKHLADSLDYSKMATGVASNDQVISQSIDQLHKKYTAMIKGGNAGVDFFTGLSGDVKQLSSYSVNTKNARTNIDTELKEYDNVLGIDREKLQKDSYRETFMQYDPNSGTFVQKPPDKIAPVSVRELIMRNPEQYSTGGDGLLDYMSKTKGAVRNETVQTDDRGRKKLVNVAVSKLNGQEVVFDNTGRPYLTFKKVSTADSKGNKVDIMDEPTYREYFENDISRKAYLEAEVRRRYPNADPKDADLIRRKVGLDIANEYGERNTSVVTRDIENERKDPNAPPNAEQSAAANKLKLGASKFQVLSEYIAGVRTDGEDINGYKEITAFIPSGGLNNAKKEMKDGAATNSNQVYAKVFVKDGRIYVQDDPSSKKFRKIESHKERDWFKEIAHGNGISPEKAAEIWDQNFAGQRDLGKEKKSNDKALETRISRAKIPLNNFMQDEKLSHLSDYIGLGLEIAPDAKNSTSRFRKITKIEKGSSKGTYVIITEDKDSEGKTIKKSTHVNDKNQLKRILSNTISKYTE